MKKEIYAPWLGKKIDWRDHIRGEMHLMAARVMGSEGNMEEQIQHGYDFGERMIEVVEAFAKEHKI